MEDKKATKILIVDDEPHIRDIVSRWLQDEGYECVTVADVDEAWKLLEEDTFSLILLDIMMPEKAGVVLLHRLREKHVDTAVVMISGLDPDGMAEHTLEFGAHTYVPKPFDRADIVISVSSALKRREGMLQAEENQRQLEDEIRKLKSEKA